MSMLAGQSLLFTNNSLHHRIYGINQDIHIRQGLRRLSPHYRQ